MIRRLRAARPLRASQSLTTPSLAGGGDEPAVGAEGDAVDDPGVAVEDAADPAGGGVPEPDDRPAVGGGEPSAVGAEGDATDAVGVAAEDLHVPVGLLVEGGRVADLDPAVAAGGGEPAAVGAEGDAPDDVGVAVQGEDLLAGLGVPELRVRSAPAEASRRPSGLKATPKTTPEWPRRDRSSDGWPRPRA